MHIKSIASAVALTAAMLVSGSAFAQTTINGAEITAEELPYVQQRCDALAAEGTGGETAAETKTNTTNSTDTMTEAPADADTVDAAGQALVTSIDLSTLTLEQCTEAGLTAAM